jgi:hypothetical protein
MNIRTGIIWVIPAEEITWDSAIPEHAVVFNKVNFED